MLHHARTMTLVAVATVLLVQNAALAAPGGMIKAVTRSPLAQLVLLLLALIFLPVILWYMIQRAIQIGRTRKDLDRLASVHPQYRWLDLKDRIRETFNWTWSAWTQQKMELASAYTTHWYWQNQQLQLDEWERAGLENVCQVISVTDVVPLFVEHRSEDNGDGSRVVVSITAKVIDYLQEKATGRVVRGDKKEGDLETIWTFKWEAGAWRLNLIEESGEELVYLRMPNVVPETVPTAA